MQGHDAGERGYGVGEKASWIGPGFVLAMEGNHGGADGHRDDH